MGVIVYFIQGVDIKGLLGRELPGILEMPDKHSVANWPNIRPQNAKEAE
jgi:hypothetical protein